MKKIKTLVVVLLVLAVVFSMVACNKDDGKKDDTPSGGAATDTGSAATGGGEKEWVSYTIGNSAWLGRFLAGLQPSESMTACDGVFDTIIRINPATRQYESDVLTRWYWEDDVTMVMEMKQGIQFSNGDFATAEDLYFSYWNHPERGSNWLQNHGIIWEQSGVRDEYTVAFKLERPYPAFEQRMIYLVNKSWSEQVGWDSEDWIFRPVGSGPYYVHEYVNDSHIVVRSRGDDYWNKEKGPIYVDEWIVRFYPDPATLYMALQVGEVDYADIADVDYGRYTKEDPQNDYKAVSTQAGSISYFMFGFNDSDLWFNKELRQAVAYGVNWADVGAVAMGSGYLEALSTASNMCADYVALGRYPFDQAKARELMEKNGYGPNNRLQLDTTMMNGAFYINSFEAIQFFMKDIYIDLDVKFADNAGAIAIWLGPGGTDCGIWYAFSGSPTGDYAVSINEFKIETGLTWSGVPFENAREQYDILTSSTDPAKRSAATKWLQQFFYDEYVYIPVAEWMLYYGWRLNSFTEKQIQSYRSAGNFIQIGRFGMESAWK